MTKIQNSCNINSYSLSNSKRDYLNNQMIVKSTNRLDITYCKSDTFELFEAELYNNIERSNKYFNIKKLISKTFISLFSVLIILFAILSVSVYEDLFKKIIFDFPLVWKINDSISLLISMIFIIGLIVMPSLLGAESNEFKNIIFSWFNKDIRKLKRLNMILSTLDKKVEVNIYNFDLENNKHWIWKTLTKSLLLNFQNVNFHIRNDQINSTKKKLEEFNVLNITTNSDKKNIKQKEISILLSIEEKELFELMQLCSSYIISKSNEPLVSLELFEYCGKNLISKNQKLKNNEFVNLQTFTNRSFKDFNFLKYNDLNGMHFNNIKFNKTNDNKKEISYYLNNHIEECLKSFTQPISFLILYFYAKDIINNEKKIILILEEFINKAYDNQAYNLINQYWFVIAGKMFDSKDLSTFEKNKNSYYRRISISCLDKLIFLFERNGQYEQALLVCEYLYEINPSKYSLNISSLYERMGQYEKAYTSLNLNFENNSIEFRDIEIKYYQRKAWIIVSQRKNELKEVGKDYLNKCENLLFSHYDNNNEMSLWHYYNIKANYNEWDTKYDDAIKNYEKCLQIPTLGPFEYGASFVNMSIAFRLIFLQNKDFDYIHKSMELCKSGIDLKYSVGDRDEMPIVLHNQALNILYYLAYYPELNKDMCLEIIDITNEAIGILDKNKSVKKLNMLLIENIIANRLIDEKNILFENRLKEELHKCENNEIIQVKDLYNKFINNHKIREIESLIL